MWKSQQQAFESSKVLYKDTLEIKVHPINCVDKLCTPIFGALWHIDNVDPHTMWVGGGY